MAEKLRLVIVEECRRGTPGRGYNRALCDGALWLTEYLNKGTGTRNLHWGMCETEVNLLKEPEGGETTGMVIVNKLPRVKSEAQGRVCV